MEIITEGISREIHDDLKAIGALNEDFTSTARSQEDFPDELSRLKKEVRKTPEYLEVHYSFGKNGTGITKELLVIGQDLYELSKDFTIILNEPNFDTPDDVYDLTALCYPHEKGDYVVMMRNKYAITEGAWGHGPSDTDEYWDETHVVTKGMLDTFVKGLNAKESSKKYTYMGLVNGFLKADHIWNEAIGGDKLFKLYDAYMNAYFSVWRDDEFINSYRRPEEARNEISYAYDTFIWLLITKYKFVDLCKHDPEKVGEVSDEPQPSKNLRNGVYLGKWFASTFKLKSTGEMYTTAIGVRCSENKTSWMLHNYVDGHPLDVRKPSRKRDNPPVYENEYNEMMNEGFGNIIKKAAPIAMSGAIALGGASYANDMRKEQERRDREQTEWAEGHLNTELIQEYNKDLRTDKIYAVREKIYSGVRKCGNDTDRIQVTPELVVDLCDKYDYDIPMLLAQAQIETHFGTDKCTAVDKHNSMFSMGCYDEETFVMTFESIDACIEPYIKLMINDYGITKETLDGILASKSLKNYDNHRYAKDLDYEMKLKATRNKIIKDYPVLVREYIHE